MKIITERGAIVTNETTERAFAAHQESGKIISYHNWHETRPSRKRPLYTVTLKDGDTLDIATLWEAHALAYGLSQDV